MSLEHISDTAYWMAYLRSIESERPDALFRDPYARQLAGTFGAAVAQRIGSTDMIADSIAIRTALLDRLILEKVVKQKIDLVLNIGSGLDTRPWRLPLPERLQWLDIDFPAPLARKAEVLADQPPKCRYGTFGADLFDSSQRSAALSMRPAATRILVVTEGLLVYLRPSQVEALAKDLHRQMACQLWLTDLIGPRALQVLRTVWAPVLRATEFHFGPQDSAAYFARLGWREDAFHSAEEEARRLRRAPRQGWLPWLFLKLGSNSFREEIRRLSGVVVLAREEVEPATVG
jgi:methyltransferase (TIGR00027 family)